MKRSNPLITCTVLSLMSMFMRYTNAKSYQVNIYIFFFFIWFSFYNFPLSVLHFFLSFSIGNPSLVDEWRKRGNFRTPICGKWWELKSRKHASSIFKEIFSYFHFHLWNLKQLSKCRVGRVSGSVCSYKITSFFVERAFYFVNILAWIEKKMNMTWTWQFV